jgi:hypothetical protein
MTAIVQQQAETFSNGVMREHREAMAFADVLELLRYSRAQTDGIASVIQDRIAAGSLTAVESVELQRICRTTLAAITAVKSMQRTLEEKSFQFPTDAVSAFDESTLELRDVLASLIDPRPWDGVKVPSEESCRSGVEPPPSWHQQDTTGLRGPF